MHQSYPTLSLGFLLDTPIVMDGWMNRWMAGLGQLAGIIFLYGPLPLASFSQVGSNTNYWTFQQNTYTPNRLKSLRKTIKVSIIASFSVTNTTTTTTMTHWRHFVVGLFCFLCDPTPLYICVRIRNEGRKAVHGNIVLVLGIPSKKPHA
jgi:hypothetical protein